MFVFVHPDFRHPQCISLHGWTQVQQVRLVVPLDVGDPGARDDLDAPAARPNLDEENP